MVSEASALNASVLLLNRLYTAVRVISVRRAISLVFKEQAEIISVEDGQYLSYDFESWVEVSQAKARFEPHAHDWLRTIRFQIAVPRIVRALSYDRRPRGDVRLNRRNLFLRDDHRCQYCGRKYPSSELSVDHVIPRSRGGTTCWENVVCACVRCNVRKGGRTPREAGLRLIAPPRRPRCSPTITVKLSDSKYASWKQFLDFAYWNVELK